MDISIQLFHMAKQVMIDALRKEATRTKYEGEGASTPFTDNPGGQALHYRIYPVPTSEIFLNPKLEQNLGY